MVHTVTSLPGTEMNRPVTALATTETTATATHLQARTVQSRAVTTSHLGTETQTEAMIATETTHPPIRTALVNPAARMSLPATVVAPAEKTTITTTATATLHPSHTEVPEMARATTARPVATSTRKAVAAEVWARSSAAAPRTREARARMRISPTRLSRELLITPRRGGRQIVIVH